MKPEAVTLSQEQFEQLLARTQPHAPDAADPSAVVAEAKRRGIPEAAALGFLDAKGRAPRDGEWTMSGPAGVAWYHPVTRDGVPGVEPTLRSVCVKEIRRTSRSDQAFDGVSYFAECVVDGRGKVTNLLSVRYHDGDDRYWPMRDVAGRIVRDKLGHMIGNPNFVAPHASAPDVSKSTWPVDMPEGQRGMWHIIEVIRPMHQLFVGATWAKLEQRFGVAPHDEIGDSTLTREQILEEQVRELQARR